MEPAQTREVDAAKQREFDLYSESYQEMLSDPMRDRFADADSEFFHTRKRDLILSYLKKHVPDRQHLSYLDVGCGFGQLMSLFRGDFARIAGCDVSEGMIGHASGLDVRLQNQPCELPFESAAFDIISAVCVYHHVAKPDRMALTVEIARVLKPRGIFVVIEHNPYNPVTQIIVARHPIDRDAQLLSPRAMRSLLPDAGLAPCSTSYFLYFPEKIYNRGGAAVEHWLSRVPLGGQYAVFSRKL